MTDSTSPPTVSQALAAEFGLSGDEYSRILEIMGRTPTLTELGVFSVMWSEHCSYKSSRVWLRQLFGRGLVAERHRTTAFRVARASSFLVIGAWKLVIRFMEMRPF